MKFLPEDDQVVDEASWKMISRALAEGTYLSSRQATRAIEKQARTAIAIALVRFTGTKVQTGFIIRAGKHPGTVKRAKFRS